MSKLLKYIFFQSGGNILIFKQMYIYFYSSKCKDLYIFPFLINSCNRIRFSGSNFISPLLSSLYASASEYIQWQSCKNKQKGIIVFPFRCSKPKLEFEKHQPLDFPLEP